MPTWWATVMPVQMSMPNCIARLSSTGFSLTTSPPRVCEGKYSIEMA